MTQSDRGAVWFVIGVGGAVALGVAMTSVRAIVSASNLAFVFIALTIVVAEMGGRAPGLATAVVSALSLNFFLTEPYLSLEIHKPGDIGAFLALAACGLIAAGFGKRRVRTAQQISRARGDLEVLARTATRLSARAPIDEVLDDVRGSSVSAASCCVAPTSGSSPPPPRARRVSRPRPPSSIRPRWSERRVASTGWGRAGFRLPDRGGRLRLPGPDALLLDLWEGSPEGLSLDERRALAISAIMIALARPTSGGVARQDLALHPPDRQAAASGRAHRFVPASSETTLTES